jgi:probable DNA metabolism protein
MNGITLCSGQETNSAVYVYDGAFDGFLTVIFDIYASKRKPAQIVSERQWQPCFFDTPVRITTSVEKSERVWNSIVTRSNKDVIRMFYLAFASELPSIEMTLYGYLEKLFADTTGTYHKNLLDDHSFELRQISRKVSFEIHRFQGFVRFQETSDGLYFAAIEPDHDIVSLLAPHFARRYGSQPWVIYDRKRDKGIYYNKPEMHEITLTDKQFDTITGEIRNVAKAPDEDLYRALWKAYYRAVNIPERKNTRLMLRLMPRRYWKYMPEKQ